MAQIEEVQETVKSEWMVARNPMMEETPYGVYRLKNRYGLNYNGNQEMAPGDVFYATRAQAQARADELNRRERKQHRVL